MCENVLTQLMQQLTSCPYLDLFTQIGSGALPSGHGTLRPSAPAPSPESGAWPVSSSRTWVPAQVALLSAQGPPSPIAVTAVSYTHLRAHETPEHLVCRLLLEKKKKIIIKK
eukprot:TRINITY_DN38282_c0_g1_i1.p1 TRINITY_DN38282_c0_g1~~TRINITY_DN38282_c0_g1_i1.p1  ORF type:complete len:112 (+),score=18.71 TRINITY_DN38282_c0_g1_i1:270-605(+)